MKCKRFPFGEKYGSVKKASRLYERMCISKQTYNRGPRWRAKYRAYRSMYITRYINWKKDIPAYFKHGQYYTFNNYIINCKM